MFQPKLYKTFILFHPTGKDLNPNIRAVVNARNRAPSPGWGLGVLMHHRQDEGSSKFGTSYFTSLF